MTERFTGGALPFFLLVVTPIVYLLSEGAYGAARPWRIMCTVVAVISGIALTAVGGGCAANAFAIGGLVAFFGAWSLGPASGAVERRRPPGPRFGGLAARFAERRQSNEQILEFTCEVSQDAPRLRIASEPWLGLQHPDPAMAVFEAPGWRHHLASNDVRRALAMLDPVLRSIVERCDAVHRGSFLMELRPGVLTIRSYAAPDEGHRWDDWSNDCHALADHLETALRRGMPMRRGAAVVPVDSTGIEVVEVGTNAARCQICGCAIEETPVRCASCGTPHHRDCWDYNGCCSVYACGGCVEA